MSRLIDTSGKSQNNNQPKSQAKRQPSPPLNENEAEQVVCVSFNVQSTYIAIGTNKGLRVSRCKYDKRSSLSAKLFHEVNGGVSQFKILGESNIFAYVGSGLNPEYPRNKVIIYDAKTDRIASELVLAAEVTDLLIREDCLMVGSSR